MITYNRIQKIKNPRNFGLIEQRIRVVGCGELHIVNLVGKNWHILRHHLTKGD